MHVEPEPWRVGKAFADALRGEKNWGHAPLNIWKAIRHCENVRLARHEFGASRGDGLYIWDAAKADGLIIINASQRPSRQRFTAAHELGHHQMHRRENESIEIADKDVYDVQGDPAERAANAFAAYLLLPDAAVHEEMGGLRNGQVTPKHLVGLMRAYSVSYEVAANRLNNTGIVNQTQRQRLLGEAEGQIDALAHEAGIDDEALFPPGEDLEVEIAKKAFGLYRDAVISAERLAKIVDLSPDEAVTEAKRLGFGRDDDLYDDEAALASRN